MTPTCPAELDAGQYVTVHAMGSWYPGVVLRRTTERVLVQYTSGAGKIRKKWVNILGAVLPEGLGRVQSGRTTLQQAEAHAACVWDKLAEKQ